MSWLASLYQSSIGQKAVMAITGLIVFGFVVGHMAGNTLVFLGPDVFNTYAATLKGNPPLLWGTRITLLIAIPLHILTAINLTRRSMEARPQGYQKQSYRKTTLAARTMRAGGVLLLVFIAFHIAHYTLHLPVPAYAEWMDAEGRHDVFRMVTDGFSNPLIAGFYVLAVTALGLHLSHGVWSALQSLGLNHPKYNDLRKKAALGFGGLISVGFALVPIAILAGYGQ